MFKFFPNLPIESLYTSLPTSWAVYVHLIKANHPKGWDAKLLAYVRSAWDMVAELPGAYRLALPCAPFTATVEG